MPVGLNCAPLPVVRADALDVKPPERRWLIHSLWGDNAAGLIGGIPKCCKSWLGLDFAVSVASGTPCLGRFPVERTGPALVYLAEDALCEVRARIAGNCLHRRLDLAALDLHVITAPVLRLDLAQDQERLRATLDQLRPRLLLLDPLVRLHRLDENSAGDVSLLLGFLRELQRTYDLAVVLTHHASKRACAQPGQALRGSSDLHAFGDSNAYVAPKDDHIVLTLEHRTAQAPPPLRIRLVAPSSGATHLVVLGEPGGEPREVPLADRVLERLRAAGGPMSRADLRRDLRVNNQHLGDTLTALLGRRQVARDGNGWADVPRVEVSAGPHEPATLPLFRPGGVSADPFP